MRWHVEEIDFSGVDVQRARADEDLLLILCAASFVESGSDLYSRNLVTFFQGDEPLCAWLRDEWEPEELQHGRALRAYIARVWPEFDWDAAFGSFFEEYSKTCSYEQFEPTRVLELVARCVIETGTSTLYRAISESTGEEVLAKIAKNIYTDEVHHYKHFFGYFKQYNEAEKLGRLPIFRALLRRVLEVRNEDEKIAMRHVLAGLYPDSADIQASGEARIKRAGALLAHTLPVDMSMKMLLKPLDLPASIQRGLVVAATGVVKPLSWYWSARSGTGNGAAAAAPRA
ncbi:ferritin-like domain-containing protein [Achromobacter aloeverae]